MKGGFSTGFHRSKNGILQFTRKSGEQIFIMSKIVKLQIIRFFDWDIKSVKKYLTIKEI